MIFSLEVLRAGKGDCLLIHLGTKKKPGLVLIDGGPATIYADYLRPRLREIRSVRSLEDQQALQIDLMMVSHVDADHIQGILDLAREETAARQTGPNQIVVKSLWHNSFDALIDEAAKELRDAATTQFGAAAVNGTADINEEVTADIEERFHPGERELVHTCLKVLAGVEQGLRLRNSAEQLGFPRNPEVGGKLIMLSPKRESFKIGGNKMQIKVLGPMLPELEQLQAKHVEKLEELRANGVDPSGILAAYVDDSVANLSSIVALAEVDGKAILLTGDARGDKVLEGLDVAGLLKAGSKKPLAVDILKVPHHGSSNNAELGFFERIVAKHYVFSGNGEHGNPERETLEWLLKARGDADYLVHLTYPIDEIDKARKKEWDKHRKSQQNRKKKAKKNKDKIKVRPAWSAAKQSLKAFLDKNQEFKSKIRIVDDGTPHVIDLSDPLE